MGVIDKPQSHISITDADLNSEARSVFRLHFSVNVSLRLIADEIELWAA